MKNCLLDVDKLTVRFRIDDGDAPAVENIRFFVKRGETLALVGESGCGKSVTAFATIGLLPKYGCSFKAETLSFDGTNILSASCEKLRRIRGDRIGFVFQDALAALDPVFTVGEQLCETVLAHSSMSQGEVQARAKKALASVDIPDPGDRLGAYPHQLSGGMRQRVMIAMALINNPDLLIADEPTTSLDVTIQAQILRLLKKRVVDSEKSMLFITHDLGVVREIADRVAVMYAGKIVEEGSTEQVLNQPLHPYTRGLIASIPDMKLRQESFATIPGRVPDLAALRDFRGCRFRERCSHAFPPCQDSHPPFFNLDEGHRAACYLLNEEGLYSENEAQNEEHTWKEKFKEGNEGKEKDG